MLSKRDIKSDIKSIVPSEDEDECMQGTSKKGSKNTFMCKRFPYFCTERFCLIYRKLIVVDLSCLDVYKRQVYVSDHSTVVNAEAISRKT